jgi:hypothetical protein
MTRWTSLEELVITGFLPYSLLFLSLRMHARFVGCHQVPPVFHGSHARQALSDVLFAATTTISFFTGILLEPQEEMCVGLAIS